MTSENGADRDLDLDDASTVSAFGGIPTVTPSVVRTATVASVPARRNSGAMTSSSRSERTLNWAGFTIGPAAKTTRFVSFRCLPRMRIGAPAGASSGLMEKISGPAPRTAAPGPPSATISGIIKTEILS